MVQLTEQMMKMKVLRVVFQPLVYVFISTLIFPRGVLDEILNLIESVSEGFPSYFFPRHTVFLISPFDTDTHLLYASLYIPVFQFDWKVEIGCPTEADH